MFFRFCVYGDVTVSLILSDSHIQCLHCELSLLYGGHDTAINKKSEVPPPPRPLYKLVKTSNTGGGGGKGVLESLCPSSSVHVSDCVCWISPESLNNFFLYQT